MSEKRSSLVSAASQCPILSALSKEEMAKLVKVVQVRHFKEGDTLMKQGEMGSDFFMISMGQAGVYLEDEEKGTKQKIAELAVGDYCGEQALLRDCKRGATIMCETDMTCNVLTSKNFKGIFEKSQVRFAKRDNHRAAISAEMLENYTAGTVVAKDDATKESLYSSCQNNVLFANLKKPQAMIVIDMMSKKHFKKGEDLIKQGDKGNEFYVIDSGTFEVKIKFAGNVGEVTKGQCVGEMALLHDAPRGATVTCTSDEGSVWSVARGAFRKALMNHHQNEASKTVGFLKKVEILRPLIMSELNLLDQALQEETFRKGQTIFEMGEPGQNFYIIRKGAVKGTLKSGETFTRGVGDYFGEKALLTSEPRAATIQASEACTFLTLNREDFSRLLGPLDEIMKRNIDEYTAKGASSSTMASGSSRIDVKTPLKQLKTIGMLGRGGFGRVTLVVVPGTDQSFALKAVSKAQVMELGQQTHIQRERECMQMMSHPFLVNLHRTYKDDFNVYFLIDACLGGELFSILRKFRSFDENTAKFYGGCVVEAFDYMHSRDIIYRDLKPENLVLTNDGYLKVTDFGFAKQVPEGSRTFTLCGTPDYLAPEIVTGHGHGKAVDWWTLGILVYEMVASFPPFFDDEPMKTYRKIVQVSYKFPRYMSSALKDFIARFLRSRSTKRLGVICGGAELVRNHPWYKGFDWKSLQSMKMPVPYKPTVKSVDDISNFDCPDDDTPNIKPSGDTSKWDADF